MAKIAIDVVILPPQQVMDKAIAINTKYQPRMLDLNKTDYLPHITLTQAIIDEADLPSAENILARIASEFKPLRLEAELVSTPAVFLKVAPTAPLIRLHEAVMKGFDPLVSYDAKAEHFFDKEIRQKTIDWIRNFKSEAAFANFNPHITIGIEQPITDDYQLEFTADRLAVCHLGNFNTCRKILYELRLS